MTATTLIVCRQTLIVLLILTASIGTAFSQIAGGLSETTRTDFGGRNYIAGNIILPSGAPAASRVRIRVSSPLAEVLAYSDDDGKFIISGLKNGTYTLTIDSDTV